MYGWFYGSFGIFYHFQVVVFAGSGFTQYNISSYAPKINLQNKTYKVNKTN